MRKEERSLRRKRGFPWGPCQAGRQATVEGLAGHFVLGPEGSGSHKTEGIRWVNMENEWGAETGMGLLGCKC